MCNRFHEAAKILVASEPGASTHRPDLSSGDLARFGIFASRFSAIVHGMLNPFQLPDPTLSNFSWKVQSQSLTAGSTGPAPVVSASAASRLVSPTTRGAVPGPRRSPWSQPEKASPSPRRSPRLQWKTEREIKSPSPSPKIGTGNTGNTGNSTGTTGITGLLPKREKGREMRAASAESLSPEKTAGKSPWPILLGSRQGSFSSFSGDTISYGLRRSNGWAALQCQEVMQTMEPFRPVSPVGVVRSKKCRPSTPPQPV